MWKAKQGASPREALGEVEAQPRLSHEDKGKTPLSIRSVAYASREAKLEPQGHEFLLASPNPRTLVSVTPRSQNTYLVAYSDFSIVFF